MERLGLYIPLIQRTGLHEYPEDGSHEYLHGNDSYTDNINLRSISIFIFLYAFFFDNVVSIISRRYSSSALI